MLTQAMGMTYAQQGTRVTVCAGEIRDIPQAQLTLPRAGIVAAPYNKELEEMAADLGDAFSVDYLGAFIPLPLGIGERSRRTQKPFYRPNRKRLTSGQKSAFEAFADVPQAAEGRGYSLEGIYFPQSFQNKDHERIWADVRATLDKVESVTGPVLLNSGTLLGVVRDQSLIAHDDDVDLAVLMQSDSQESAARDWQDIRLRLQEAGLLSDKQVPNPGVYTLRSGGTCKINLVPAWIADGKLHVYPHTYGDLPGAALLPLATCKVTGLPIPARAEEVLDVNYGEGWRVPDPGFSFPWSRANRRFRSFMDALGGNQKGSENE